MKKIILYISLLLLLPFMGFSQQPDSKKNKWAVEASALLYFIPDDFFVLPIVKADKNKLHLEGRYNYEDRKTVSFFGGYNFTGGNKIEYTITPMLGIALGNSDGIAPGLEMDFTWGKFELYSEMEYLFEFNEKSNSYYYNWTEFTFAPKEWLWVGITGQRTRLYQTSLDIQRGLLAGLSWKNASVSGYLFNPFTDDTFGILSLSISF
jgi:hypothetical protein